MTILINSFIFIFGLIIGSFLNCVIYRQEQEKSLSGRSFCPQCGHVLSWKDLIPVLSFLLLKGKCRYCKNRISWQYPAVELASALAFLLIFSLPKANMAEIICLLAISSALIVIFVFDLKHFIIPDRMIIFASFFAFLYRIFAGNMINSLFSAVLASLFFLIIFLVSRGRAMGFGDVKLALFMGLFLGWPAIIIALFFAFWAGAVLGLILIAFKKKTMKSEVPFGPFLIVGVFIAFFWSREIISWYLNLVFLI